MIAEAGAAGAVCTGVDADVGGLKMERKRENKPTPALAAAATGCTRGTDAAAGSGAFSRRGSAGNGAGCDGVMVFTTGCWRSSFASA